MNIYSLVDCLFIFRISLQRRANLIRELVMSKKKLTRRDREKQKHKEEILKAALKLFADRGFHDVSMQDIAEESEFGVGTLYNFFKSKDALFEELISGATGRVMGEIIEILDGPGNEKERLAAFIRYQPKLQEENGALIKLYLSELAIKGSKLCEINEESKRCETIDSKMIELVKQGIEKGLFRAVDPEIAVKALGAINEKITFETAGRFDREAVTEIYKKVEYLFLDGLLKPEG